MIGRQRTPLLLGICILLATSAGAEVAERANPTAERIRIRGELGVTTDSGHTTLTVASERHDYVVFLPYSDAWNLESTEEDALTALDGQYTVTVSHRAKAGDDPRPVLDEALDELLTDNVRVRFLQYVEREGREVLCLQIRYSDTGNWHWFYWLLVPDGRRWLQLTVLDADPGELAPLDIDLVETIVRSMPLEALLGEIPDDTPADDAGPDGAPEGDATAGF